MKLIWLVCLKTKSGRHGKRVAIMANDIQLVRSMFKGTVHPQKIFKKHVMLRTVAEISQ